MKATASPTRPAKGWSLWLPPLVLTAIVLVVALQWSCVYGRLSMTAAYDDVSYLAEGLTHYLRLCDQGFVRFARGIAAAPPHSPLTLICSIIGFAIFGAHDWAPYVVHGSVLLLVMLVLSWMARGAGRLPRVCLLIAFALLPLSWQSVMEFRPDAAASFATALGCVLIIQRLPERATSRRGLLIIGLAALALVSKPPVFPATLALFGLACVSSIAAQRLGMATKVPGFLRERTMAMLRLGGLSALVVSPYYLFAGPRVVHYIMTVLFDKKEAAVWSFGTSEFTLKQHALYYLTGPGHLLMMGDSLLWLLIGGATVCALVGLYGSRDAKARCAAIVVVVAASYGVVFVNVTKTPFFGMTFYTLLVVGVFSGLCHVATINRLKGKLVLAAILPLFAMTLSVLKFRIPQSPVIQVTPTSRAADNVIRDVIDHTIELAQSDNPAVLTIHVGHLGHRLLELQGLKRGVHFGGRGEFPFETDPAYFAGELELAEMVLTADADADMVHQGFPVTKSLAAIRAMIDARIDFVLAFERRTPSGGRVSLFRRRPDFEGLDRSTGLGPVEGPFPQWKLPRVRWAKETGVRIETDPGQDRFIVMRAWARAQSRTIKVVVDGETRDEWIMAERGVALEHQTRLKPSDRVVELTFDAPSIDGPPGTSALFERIQILPASVVERAAKALEAPRAPGGESK